MERRQSYLGLVEGSEAQVSGSNGQVMGGLKMGAGHTE